MKTKKKKEDFEKSSLDGNKDSLQAKVRQENKGWSNGGEKQYKIQVKKV